VKSAQEAADRLEELIREFNGTVGDANKERKAQLNSLLQIQEENQKLRIQLAECTAEITAAREEASKLRVETAALIRFSGLSSLDQLREERRLLTEAFDRMELSFADMRKQRWGTKDDGQPCVVVDTKTGVIRAGDVTIRKIPEQRDKRRRR
jgi:hypothetical protein